MPYYPLGYGTIYGYSYYKKNTCWESDSKEIKQCSLVEKTKVKIKIPLNLYLKFLSLVKEINTEWLLYLTYEKEEKGNQITYTVKDYVVPDQEVTSTSVKVLDPPKGSYGVIHAHQFTSSKFFSDTDDEYVNSNNVFSLVINGNGEIIGKSRLDLPCGNYLLKDCEVEILLSDEEKDENIVSEVKNHLKIPTYTYTKTKASLKPVKDCPYNDIECYYFRHGKCTFSSKCPYHLDSKKETKEENLEVFEEIPIEAEEYIDWDYCPFAFESCPFYTRGYCSYPFEGCYAIDQGVIKECPFNNDECNFYVYGFCVLYENPEVECDEFGNRDLEIKEDGGSSTSENLRETRNSRYDSRGGNSSLHLEKKSGKTGGNLSSFKRDGE